MNEKDETYDCCLRCKHLFGNALSGDYWVCRHPKYGYDIKVENPLHHVCDDFKGIRYEKP